MPFDISLTEASDGKPLMHRPDCPLVDRHRREGRPIATLYQCESLPDDVRRHHCMREGEDEGDA